jgi:hypothetical protein
MPTNVKHDVFSLYNMNVGEDECWVWNGGWGGRDRTRRPYFPFGGHRMIAYRAVYELVHGVKLNSDQLVRHTCDNGGAPIGCGNPAHLGLGNNAENMNDMVIRNRHGLTRNAVKGIRRLLDQGRPQQDIADLYGVSQSSISAIAIRRTYVGLDTDDGPEELEPINVRRDEE